MKTKWTYLSLLALPLLFWQCEVKDDPLIEEPVEQSEPLFWLSAEIDGNPHTWEAGVNGVVLDHEIVSGTSVGGRFHQPDCDNECDAAIQFEWFAPSNSANLNSASLEALIKEQPYNFARPVEIRPTEVKIRFRANPIGNIAKYFWELSDGRTTTEKDPLLVFYPTADNHEVDVCLTVKDHEGNTSQLCNTIDLLSDCQQRFEYESTNTDKIYMWAGDVNYAGNFRWDLGNGHEVITSGIELAYPDNKVADLVTVSGRTQDGCEWSWQRWVPLNKPDHEVLADFDYEVTKITPSTTILEQNITVGITYDLHGTEYTSFIKTQPGQSIFEVVNLENLVVSEVVGDVKKVEFEFGCELYDEHGNKISLENGHGMIAVGF